jgi:hypothetical protein
MPHGCSPSIRRRLAPAGSEGIDLLMARCGSIDTNAEADQRCRLQIKPIAWRITLIVRCKPIAVWRWA